MATEAVVERRSAGRRLADFFHGRPRLQVGALLAGPVGWPVIGDLQKSLSFENFETLFDEPVYRTIVFRTVLIAALVTITDAILAFPIAFYMAKVASNRTKAILVIAVLVPLWSSYLVKVLSWRNMLGGGGLIDWVLEPFGLSGPGFGNTAVWLVMSYLWLPYMILPIFAGLERIPDSLISASEDLGAKPFTTFRRVILPLAFPAVVAGSIFTFALTLGDYITPKLVSNNQFIGNVVYNNILSDNLPFAAALALVPIVIMVGYLLVARKLGAFEHI